MAQPLKVLHLTYDMRIGGTEQVIKNIIQGMRGDTFEHSILCLESPIGPFGEILITEGITINALKRKDGFDISLIKQIRHHIKKNSIDVLHCHQYTPWVYGSLAAALGNTKVFFTEHGRLYPDKSSWKRKLVNPLLSLLTDQITAIAQATKQALIDFEHIPGSQIDVIYNGITPFSVNTDQANNLKRELQIPENSLVLGTVARLDPIKNQTMMIEAFSLVAQQHDNCYLLIVGDGEERTRLESLAGELLIHDKVIFTGYISKPDTHIAIMDIFLLSSLSEGASMTLLEAMNLGVPCVVTDAGGNKEIITSEVGHVCPEMSTTSFQQGINKVIEREPGSFTDKAKERFEQHFSVSTMVKSYTSLYTEQDK